MNNKHFGAAIPVHLPADAVMQDIEALQAKYEQAAAQVDAWRDRYRALDAVYRRDKQMVLRMLEQVEDLQRQMNLIEQKMFDPLGVPALDGPQVARPRPMPIPFERGWYQQAAAIGGWGDMQVMVQDGNPVP